MRRPPKIVVIVFAIVLRPYRHMELQLVRRGEERATQRGQTDVLFEQEN